MLNSCNQLKSKHKEKKCEPQTASTNTILDDVMLRIPVEYKVTAIPKDNKRPRLREMLYLYLLLLTNCNNNRLIKQVC